MSLMSLMKFPRLRGREEPKKKQQLNWQQIWQRIRQPQLSLPFSLFSCKEVQASRSREELLKKGKETFSS